MTSQAFNRLAFDIVVVNERMQADLDLTLDTCERRGARINFTHGIYNLYVPDDLEIEPFRETLDQCKAVSWIANHIEHHVITGSNDD